MASSDPFVSKGGATFTSEIPSAIDTRQVQWELYKSQQFTDFTLITRSQEYKVHRVVIVALCCFLLPILTNNPSLSSLGLTIDDEMMHFLLEFAYLGRVEVPLEFASALGDAAKKLGIKQLADDCQRVVLTNCVPSVSNCLRGWASANHINDQMFIHKFEPLALQNFKELVDDGSFQSLDLSSVKLYVSHASLAVECPDDRLLAAITWVSANTRDRLRHLPSIITCLDLNSMNKCTLKFIANRDPVVSVHSASRAILTAAAAASVKPASTMASASLIATASSVTTASAATSSSSATSSSAGPSSPAGPSSSAAPSSSATPSSSVAVPRKSCTATVWGGSSRLSIYAASWTSPLREVDSPNTTTGRLHDEVACCGLGKSIYIAGAGQDSSSIMMYDVIQESWQTCGQLRHARELSCMCVSDSSLLVIAGYKPGSYHTLVGEVEMVDITTHRVTGAGRLRGVSCYPACCCVCDGGDVAVLGPTDERITWLLQLYEVKTRAPAGCIKLPSEFCDPCGIVHVNGQLVFKDHTGSIYTTPVSAVRQQVATRVQNITRFTSPHTYAVLTQRDSQLILLGGRNATHHVHMADVTEVLANQGQGWLPIGVQWAEARCCYPGAVCTLSLPASAL